MEETLRHKTINGVGWNTLGTVIQYGVVFIVGIVLARILSPDAYGLIGLTAIFTVISNAIVNSGFYSALVRKKDATEDDFSTVFIANLVLSIAIYFILFAIAPWVADFFEREELVSLLRIASIGVIIGAFAIVQRAQLTKRMDFRTQAQVTLFAAVGSGVAGIAMAVTGFGVWALVVQSLLQIGLETIGLWAWSHWLPKMRFSWTSFKELFGYSWKLLVSNVLDSVWKELTEAVVGKFYSPATLGQYTRAHRYAGMFSSNITQIVQKVSFPALSELQSEPKRMTAAFRKIIKTTMLPVVVCMFGLGAVAQPLIYCLIGEKWHDCATYLPYICIIMSLYPLHAINLNMLQVQGRSDIYLVLEIIKKILLLIPLVIGIWCGILPMLWTMIGISFIALFLNAFYAGKQLRYSAWAQLKDIAPSYTIGIIVALSVYFLRYLPLSNWIILPLQIIIGSLITWGLCEWRKKEEYVEIKHIILTQLHKRKHYAK